MALFIGIEGLQLTPADKKRLCHSQTSGIILFSRNYEDIAQLSSLITAIRHLRPDILIAVDHEGGRVQRFRHGFTHLPAAAIFGHYFDNAPQAAYEWCEVAGKIMAYELRCVGIDFSFAPVLDLQDVQSSVIGERAFHANPAVVAVLSMALRKGLSAMGMAAVGKHFPGHGRVTGDSHLMLPCDKRDYASREADRFPFFINIQDGIQAIMSAHIMLPEDDKPAGFSMSCLQSLREMGFDGAIISDDLDMAGAKFFPSAVERVQAALDAGADVAMICNAFADMDMVLAHTLRLINPERSFQRLQALRAQALDSTFMEQEYKMAKEIYNAHLATASAMA